MPETSFLFRDVCSIAYSLIVAQAGILIFFGGGGGGGAPLRNRHLFPPYFRIHSSTEPNIGWQLE